VNNNIRAFDCHGINPEEIEDQSVLRKYLQLLLKADRRQRSREGKEIVGLSGTGCIDKLSFALDPPVSRQQLTLRSNRSNIPLKPIKLRDQRWYLQAGDGWYFKIRYFNSDTVFDVITRPAFFPLYSAYLENLCQLLTVKELKAARITRLDFTVDYLTPFAKFMRGLDIAHKRARVEHIDKGSVRTGFRVGSQPETILVYDRAFKAGLEQPSTRLEIQLTGTKLPARSFRELSACRELDYRPFRSVKLYNVSLAEPSLLNPIERSRHAELSVLLEREGYFSARKKLDEAGQFNRHYLPLMNRTRWTQTPDQALHEHLSAFLDLG
jgi:hypothetical protein